MKKYEKPEAISLSTSAEGIFMASGDTLKTCRFGRTEASAGSDTCQECSKSAGLLHIAKLNGRICGAKRSHSVSEQPNCYQSV